MQYRRLGKNGPEVSVLGFGAWPLGGGMGPVDETTAVKTIHCAIDNGITLIDTAQAYRSSESVIGRALKGGFRDRCFLATKVSHGNYARAAMRTAMEESLRALQTDHVDLYQIHGWRGDIPIEEQMGALVELREEGKTRYIGVSNYNEVQLEAALGLHAYDSLQPRYNLLHRDIESAVLPYCRENGIGVLAHSTLAKGLLAGRYRPGHVFPDDDERSRMDRFRGEEFARSIETADKLNEVAREKGLSLIQLAVAWVLREPVVTCALVGAKAPEQVLDHLPAAEAQLSADELERIDAILESR